MSSPFDPRKNRMRMPNASTKQRPLPTMKTITADIARRQWHLMHPKKITPASLAAKRGKPGRK